MTFKEWANEYYQSALGVKNQIEETKKAMKTAGVNDMISLGKKLSILQGMYYDCMETARTLGSRKGDC